MSPVRLLELQDLVDERQPGEEDLVAEANAFSARFDAPYPRLVKPQLCERSARVTPLPRKTRSLQPAA